MQNSPYALRSAIEDENTRSTPYLNTQYLNTGIVRMEWMGTRMLDIKYFDLYNGF